MKHFITEYWKIIVGLTAIFVGGLGFGGVLESLRHRDKNPAPAARHADGDWIESTLANLDESLSLTEAQKESIRPHLVKTAREIQLNRQSALLKFEISLLDLHKAIVPELEESQLAPLAKSQKRLESRIRERSESVLESFPLEK